MERFWDTTSRQLAGGRLLAIARRFTSPNSPKPPPHPAALHTSRCQRPINRETTPRLGTVCPTNKRFPLTDPRQRIENPPHLNNQLIPPQPSNPQTSYPSRPQSPEQSAAPLPSHQQSSRFASPPRFSSPHRRPHTPILNPIASIHVPAPLSAPPPAPA